MTAVHGKQQLQEKFDNYYQQIQHHQSDPVSLYLDSLAPTGRRSAKSLLCSTTAIVGFEGELEQMPGTSSNISSGLNQKHP